MKQMNHNLRLRQRGGFTLVEIVIVMVIMLILMSLVLPGLSTILAGNKSKSALLSVRAMMSLARSRAAELQRRVGIRFQFGAEDWQKGTQYMVLVVETDSISTQPVFVAAENTRPMPLPDGVVLFDGSIDEAANPDLLLADGVNFDTLNDAVTFTILFTPTGQVFIQNGFSVNKNNNSDKIFNDQFWVTKPKADQNRALLVIDAPIYGAYLNGSLETSATRFYIAERDKLMQCDPAARWTGYLAELKPVILNIYSGQFIKDWDN